MFNLSLIVYSIFAIVFFGFIIVGYKRGAKVALYCFILSLVTIGISIGVYFAFAKILGNFYLFLFKKIYQQNDFSLQPLLSTASHQLIPLICFLLFTPIFLLLFFATTHLRRWIIHKEQVKNIESISNNSKTVIRRNTRFLKLSGLAVTSTTALIMGSIASAGASSFLTPTKKYNAFNSATNFISKIATFGQGYDNYDTHLIYDFLPLTIKEREMLLTFRQILSPDENTNFGGAYFKIKITDNDSFQDFQRILNNIQNVDIILNIINKSGDGTTNSGWLPLGHEENEANNPYTHTTSNLENDYKDLNLQLSQDAASNIINWIRENGIQKFESTQYWKSYTDAKQKIEDIKRQLEVSTTQLRNREDSLKEQKDLISRKINEANEFIKKIESYILTYKSTIREVSAQEQIKNTADSAYQSASVELLRYEASSWSPAKSDLNDKNKELNDAKNILNNLNSQLKSLQQQQYSSDKQQKDLEHELNNLHDTLIDIQQKIDNLEHKNSRTTNEEAQLAGLKSNLLSIQAKITSKQTNKQTIELEISRSQQSISSIESQILSAKIGITNYESEARAAQIRFTPIDKQHDIYKSKTDEAQRKMSNEKIKYESLLSSKNNIKNILASLKNDFDSAINSIKEAYLAQNKLEYGTSSNIQIPSVLFSMSDVDASMTVSTETLFSKTTNELNYLDSIAYFQRNTGTEVKDPSMILPSTIGVISVYNLQLEEAQKEKDVIESKMLAKKKEFAENIDAYLQMLREHLSK